MHGIEKQFCAMILHAALLYVIQEAVLLEGLLPDTDDVVLGLADGGGQQVGDILEDLADGMTKVCLKTCTGFADLQAQTLSN